ncbi:hypothetical protein FSP39_019033 [Pinctada imbricata]|uniref:Uncharacterized protein n=1 Tax=Pinctada imbricata TaxID=66713 RepID=A0AA89C3U5_PINIB|nr:hypothetical protein FSP39_019033 [Pinctada imbricata]
MNSLTCECNCSAPVNMTHEQLMERLEELRSILTIVKKDTLKSKLKLISVRDDRPSSTAIGALGIILITLVIALVVLIDSMNLLTFLQKRKIKEKKA